MARLTVGCGCSLHRDRVGQFTDAFDEVFRTKGFKLLRTPVRTPLVNTFAERWTSIAELEATGSDQSHLVDLVEFRWSVCRAR